MPRTGDQAFIKSLNRSIVLNLIRRRSPISRTQVAQITGLNKATVSTLVNELIQDDLVQEIGCEPSAHVGRKPILISFNANAGRVIGVDIGVNYIRVVATDLAANICQTYESTLDPQHNFDENFTHIIDAVQRVIHTLSPTTLGIVGIGVGVPGLVDFYTGSVINAPNLHWKNIPIREQMEQQLRLPVLVDNEANVGALGEKLFGIGKDVPNLVYVSVGIGIGSGIVIDGQLLRGEHGLAGEFGHMTIEVDGPRCSCGNRGCLEIFASETAIEQSYLQKSGKKADLYEIKNLLEQNDNFATAAVRTAGHYLGIGIANILNGLNPSLVIIGNRASQLGNWLLTPVEQTVHARSFVARYSSIPVRLSALGRDASAIGAGALVLHRYFSEP